jgi:hypothetical protein
MIIALRNYSVLFGMGGNLHGAERSNESRGNGKNSGES